MTGLMAEVVPNNTDLIAGAKAAVKFVPAHMFNNGLPGLYISANVTEKCSANRAVSPSFPAWFLSGLSTIASITQEQDLIDQ